MRCLEVLAIGGYLFGLIYSMQVISIFEYWTFLSRNYPEHLEKFRTCFLEEGEWSGTTLKICYIEVAIYMANMLTMVILIIKSRWKKVGIDNDE